ncbi:TIGR03767 family metallophosphoesterase [Saccharopolyspora sp. ID03-671]|uniref:TIGR03767 family metallophosphoesterase n=1 Tax=Saccharopolyspora sp. ID03-671 TaxID=3073066 RepID=UPI0032453307
MTDLSRRGFMLAAGMTGVGMTGAALGLSGTASAAPARTTLDVAAQPAPGEGYRRLIAGPGWPQIVRTDLAVADPGRIDRRVPVTAFTQFTDLHITDAQSPARFEYLHPLAGGAFRPQETLGALAAAHLVQRVNQLRTGPVTGHPMDFMITTGDSTDNHERAELDWYFAVLNGGPIAQNTGAAHYEGVQDSGDPLYWHPEGGIDDRYRERGFPVLPGLLTDALRPFAGPGLDIPWYAVFGNHDNSVMGTLADQVIPRVNDWYTGDRKIIGRDEREAAAVAEMLRGGREVSGRTILGGNTVVRTVTPDQRRHPFTTEEFIAAHLDEARTGPGPVGHGFDAADPKPHYTFRIAPGVTGIAMDSTNTAGLAEGSLGLDQYRWLDDVLTRGSSTYYDAIGRKQTQHVTDELFVLFSHHTSGTMTALWPDFRSPGEPRVGGDGVVRLLQRFPNVLAWVNGHTHRNTITPHGADDPERAFWEINTASHVDYPQLARVIEIADNRDGTISLFTTLIEADSPYQADYDDRSPAGLAALYRELSFNDPNADLDQLGDHTDRNTELLLPGRLPR